MSTTRCPGSAAHLGDASPPIWGWRRRHRTKSWYTWPSNRSRHFLTLFICLLCLVVIIIIYLFDVARVDVSLTTANYLAAPSEPSQTRTNTRVTSLGSCRFDWQSSLSVCVADYTSKTRTLDFLYSFSLRRPSPRVTCHLTVSFSILIEQMFAK